MKKEKSKGMRAKSPDRLILKVASGNPIQTGQWIQSQSATTRSPFLWSVYPSDGAGSPETFIPLQGQGSGFTIGKGPPGLSPGPGGGVGRDPDNKAGPPTGKAQSKNTLQSNNTVLSINKKQNSNFLQLLIFKIMKKQILILVLFVMATFAGVNNSYGQCAPGAFSPAAGVAYEYDVTVTGTAGATEKLYNWYVTKNVNILSAIIAAGTDFTVNAGANLSTYNETLVANAAATYPKISLTWTTLAIASTDPYYLVVKYSEKNASACTVENMRVWEIKPINTFLLAIAGSDVAGNVANNFACAANVKTALVNTPATPTVTYTFDVNTIYYKVTASGAAGVWTPQLNLPALAGNATYGQKYVSVEYSSDNGTTWLTFGTPAANGGALTLASTLPVTVAPVSYLIRIVVDNLNYQNDVADQTITLGVDGELPNAIKDIINPATDCNAEANFGKTGAFNILHRPAIAPNVGTFITPLP